jgi:hypothetical protein
MPLPFPLTIGRLPENVQITANMEHEFRNVGGLSALIVKSKATSFSCSRKTSAKSPANVREWLMSAVAPHRPLVLPLLREFPTRGKSTSGGILSGWLSANSARCL